MPSTFAADIEQFIQEELASGQHPNEQAVVNAALEVYRELKTRHNELRDGILVSLEQARHGDATSLDIDEIISELDSELDELEQSA
jgi:Arc/MetJ-type ribon-helix-helix transcriptional regulator